MTLKLANITSQYHPNAIRHAYHKKKKKHTLDQVDSLCRLINRLMEAENLQENVLVLVLVSPTIHQVIIVSLSPFSNIFFFGGICKAYLKRVKICFTHKNIY